jgi:hypothetical protein
MKRHFVVLFLVASTLAAPGCGKEEKAEPKNQIKEKVKEVVTQPFATYDAAKDSLNASKDKTKAALDDQDKALKQ